MMVNADDCQWLLTIDDDDVHGNCDNACYDDDGHMMMLTIDGNHDDDDHDDDGKHDEGG